jgi:hypothetical protein
MSLVKAPFTPDPSLVLADLTLADFNGANPLISPDAVPTWGVDPITGNFIAPISPPAGGWFWEAGDATTNMPQTIYGWALCNNAVDTLLATGLIDPPVLLSAARDAVFLGTILLRINNAFIS